jgi:hypothetical protein
VNSKRPQSLNSTDAGFGRLLVLSGRSLLWLAVTAPFAAILLGGERPGVASTLALTALGVAASVVLGALGAVMVSYGRRLQIPPGEPLAADPARHLVLYLRSFAIDSDRMPGTEAAQAMQPTAEEHLRDRLARVGEMVAIGRPGEPLPPIGVPRIYRDEEQWRAAVLDLMHRSRLTVLAYGTSPGLLWEVESALSHVPAERLLLWFPTRELWQAFRSFASTDPTWIRGLPSLSADVRLMGFRRDGTPRVLEVHGTTIVHDFSSEHIPDATAPGQVSAGGLETYLDELAVR